MQKLSFVLCVALTAGHALAQNPQSKAEKKDQMASEEMYVDEVKDQQSAIQREKTSSENGTHMNPDEMYSKEKDQRQEEDTKRKGR